MQHEDLMRANAVFQSLWCQSLFRIWARDTEVEPDPRRLANGPPGPAEANWTDCSTARRNGQKR